MRTLQPRRTVYKVVRRNDDGLRSCLITNPDKRRDWRDLAYFPGHETKPQCGKLFAFDTLDAARSFVGLGKHPEYKDHSRLWPYREIWAAEAGGVEHPDYVGNPISEWYRKFWNGVEAARVPSARYTVLCGSIRLTECLEETGAVTPGPLPRYTGRRMMSYDGRLWTL